jgi:hypothetical protein
MSAWPSLRDESQGATKTGSVRKTRPTLERSNQQRQLGPRKWSNQQRQPSDGDRWLSTHLAWTKPKPAPPLCNPSHFISTSLDRTRARAERTGRSKMAVTPPATPLAGERIHPRVCASPLSGFGTAPLGGGQSERIRWTGKVGCSGALPGTQHLPTVAAGGGSWMATP